ncbi:MAG: archaemetzincin family Zn-dependent metalloprotease [Desulfurococcaceae archaeon]
MISSINYTVVFKLLKILLVPLTTHGVLEYIDNLSVDVKRVLDKTGVEFEVIIWPDVLKPPMRCFDWSRLQYHAGCVLKYLKDQFQRLGLAGKFYITGIGYLDAYEFGLNFVFGEANPDYKVAAVFTKRLKPEFYNEPPNYSLYYNRLIKETVHELGHLIRLEHCDNPKCVMRFSNSIAEVDEKSSEFCERCKAEIRRWVRTS